MSETICFKLIKEKFNVIQAISLTRYKNTYYRFSLGDSKVEIETNPFNRLSNKSIDLYLFQQAANQENENVTIFTKHYPCPPMYCHTIPEVVHATIYKQISNHQIFTRYKGKQWLTCYTKKFLAFDFYVTPFQLDSWIVYLITMITVIGVSWIYVKYFFKDSTSLTMSFSPWLFVLGTIFEETSSAPAKLEKQTFYRLSIGIWCLMVATLTSCYNGLMITGLNSPLPGSKIQSFCDLLCDTSLIDSKNQNHFNISQWMETSKIHWYWKQLKNPDQNQNVTNPYESKDCFRILSPHTNVQLWNANVPQNILYFELSYVYEFDRFNMMINSNGGSTPGLLSYSDKILWSLLHPGHPREPETITKLRVDQKRDDFNNFDDDSRTKNKVNTENELELVRCEQKSVYFASGYEFSLLKNFLSKYYPDKKFTTGKDDELLWIGMEGFMFQGIRNTKIPMFYRWMIDSGIYERLEEEKVARMTRLRRKIGTNKLLQLEGVSSLEGGLVTLFIFCGGIICIILICFIVEIRRIIWNRLVKCYFNLVYAFKICRQKMVIPFKYVGKTRVQSFRK